MGKEGN